MNRSYFSCLILIMTIVLLAVPAPEISAQIPVQMQVAAPMGKPAAIRKIDSVLIRTPMYTLTKSQMMAIGQAKDWAEFIVEYETYAPWVDELTFTYYILVRSKEPGQKAVLFRGDVSYRDIEKGKHKSDVFLHPSTIARYGAVERVAVEVRSQGRVLDIMDRPLTGQRWWEQMAPVDGYVRNRLETPFAMINYDDYEAIKPGNRP